MEADGEISRKSVDEESTLRENGEGWRLACVSEVRGGVRVRVGGEVGKAQWTR